MSVEPSRGSARDSGPADYVVLENLSKSFQGQAALKDVSLTLRRGEVHALLGQNGSGKSTLIKILAGYHQTDTGTATVDGKELELGSPSAAHDAGLRFIHQDLALIDTFDVVDNLALGETYRNRWWLSARAERRAARQTFAEYGINIDVSQPLTSLDAAQRTMTAIVRALHHGQATEGVLVLDEPTASLAETDKQRLFDLIRLVRARGGTVLYVTHRLQEVFEIADRVTVLRNGENIATRKIQDLDHAGLVRLIIGRDLEALYPEIPAALDDVALDVTHLGGGSVADVSLRLRAGEILGITGLTGSGADELLHLVFGATRRTTGEIRIGDRAYSGTTPAHAIRAGLAFAPGDRKRLGGILSWTLRENVTLPRLRSLGLLRRLSPRRERADARSWLDRFEVVPENSEATFATLSGGNQQKVVLAKWVRSGASVLLLEEPTQGVDIGAKSAIYEALANLVAQGTAILMSSSDFEEVCSVSDRVLVMRNGRIGAVLDGDARTVGNVLNEILKEDG